jgi:thioredoxin reductase (NADPH)
VKNEPIDQSITALPLTASRADQIFPTLTLEQIERIASYGPMRAVRAGEVLAEHWDSPVPFFVILSGEVEAVRPSGAIETLITIFRAGQFTGEVNSLSGRRAMARLRARTDGKVIQLSRERLLALVQTDGELSACLYPSAGGVSGAGRWGRNAGWFQPFGRYTADQGIPHS